LRADRQRPSVHYPKPGRGRLGHLPRQLQAPETPSGAVLINDAIVTSTMVDPNPANNLASLAITIGIGGTPEFPADLVVTITGPATVVLGQSFAYTITVTNNGPYAANHAVISGVIPPDTTIVLLEVPLGWGCTRLPPAGGVGPFQCAISSPPLMPAGETATITLTVQAQAGTPSGASITNVVTVDPFQIDPTVTNNRATLSTLIQVPTATPTATVTATPIATRTPTPTSTVTPSPTPLCILGDINCDGIVDIRDYGLWRQAFGQQGAGNRADLNRDDIVDIRDYGLWRQHFGEGTPPDRRGGGPLPAGVVPASGSGTLLWAEDSGLAVPVIPLVGGLLGLGGLVGWRARRPPDAE
jgi:uncharacterized repeat protein (TIGR01451 family)